MHDCKWDEYTSYLAARRGHLENPNPHKAVDKAVEQAEAMMRKAEEIEAQLEQADHTLKRIDEDGPGSTKHSGGSIGASR